MMFEVYCSRHGIIGVASTEEEAIQLAKAVELCGRDACRSRKNYSVISRRS